MSQIRTTVFSPETSTAVVAKSHDTTGCFQSGSFDRSSIYSFLLCTFSRATGVCVPRQLRYLLDMFCYLENNNNTSIRVNDNPWVVPPEDVVRNGQKAVSQYFEDLFAESRTTRPNSVQFVLVGQEGAGKTRSGFRV